MLNLDELTGIHRKLQDDPVLSVYLNTDQHDPAQRSTWRTHLDNRLSEVEAHVEGADGDDGELEAFKSAVARLRDELPGPGFFPGKGWVAWVGPETVHHVESVPFRPPNQVHWGRGPQLAPYLRGLRQLRPVLVVMADRQRARFLTFAEGDLEELPGLTAFRDVGDVTDSGQRKSPSRTSGQRGATAKDLAQRFLDVEADRLHDEVVKRIREKLGREALLLLGGPSESTAHVLKLLPSEVVERTRVVSNLRMDESVSQVRERIGDETSELSRSLQDRVVDQVLELARANGRACTGTESARKVLTERRAELLLLSDSTVHREPALADALLTDALDQGARVEMLVGHAADQLDEQAEGVAVRMRY